MLILADKPTWMSSYDVIRRLKRLFPKGTKIWHAGTLDPLATWVMLIGVWPDTKRLTSLTGLDKTYEVLIDLSRVSDTRDRDAREMIESVTIDPWAVPGIIERIPGLLGSLVPEAMLPVPSFSAKKKDGQKLYDLARKWVMTEEMRTMRIHEVSQIWVQFPVVSCRISVWSGTYIRSIAYRLGQQLGTGGIVQELRRVSVGSYALDQVQLTQQREGISYAEVD